MSSATLTRLPLLAGSVLLVNAGRAGLWALSRYMRAPGTNTAILALMTVTAMGASNALYNQDSPHPAPLFAAPATSAPETAAIPEAERKIAPKLVTTTAITRPAPVVSEPVAAPASGAIGNADVAAVQKKLAEMNLFSGTVDGYYGPKTAAAIRAFEEKAGLPPQGALTPAVVSAILKAPADQGASLAIPLAADEPVETAALPVATRPAAAPVSELVIDEPVETTDLPMPAPLTAPRGGEASVKPASAVRTVAANSPDLFNQLADQAANAFEAISGMVGEVAGDRRQPMPRPLAETREIAYKPAALVQTPVSSGPAETNRELVTKVQRGLASLGFLAGTIDGVAGAATAKAIRNFEVYYSYDVTGRVSPELLRLLLDAGATI